MKKDSEPEAPLPLVPEGARAPEDSTPPASRGQYPGQSEPTIYDADPPTIHAIDCLIAKYDRS
jgi:hypothetical protein